MGGFGGRRACERKCGLGKWSFFSPPQNVASTCEAATESPKKGGTGRLSGEGPASAETWRVHPGVKEGDEWGGWGGVPPGNSLGQRGNWKLSAMPAGGPQRLGEELRRGSRPSMCGGKVQGCAAALPGKPINQHYTRHSQLAFVVPPSFFFGAQNLFLDSVCFISFIKWPDARCAVGYNKVTLSDLNHEAENILCTAFFRLYTLDIRDLERTAGMRRNAESTVLGLYQ